MKKEKMIPCVVCGRPTATRHHLIFGNGRREICEADKSAGVVVPLCDECHTLGKYRLHDNPVAEYLSKALGQALWEQWHVYKENKMITAEARTEFVRRYGKGWL